MHSPGVSTDWQYIDARHLLGGSLRDRIESEIARPGHCNVTRDNHLIH